MNDKLLKPYKGFTIEKSWEVNADGTIKKSSVVYAAYNQNGDSFDACSNLAKLKEKIDIYVN